MDIEKIMNRMTQMQAHLKANSKNIPKSIGNMMSGRVNEAITIIEAGDPDEIAQFLYEDIRRLNKKLGDYELSWSGTPALPTQANAEVTAMGNAARPLLIDSFQLVDPHFFRGRGGRVLTAEGFADYVIGAAVRRLEQDYDKKVWDAKFPITLKEVEETPSDDGGEV